MQNSLFSYFVQIALIVVTLCYAFGVPIDKPFKNALVRLTRYLGDKIGEDFNEETGESTPKKKEGNV